MTEEATPVPGVTQSPGPQLGEPERPVGESRWPLWVRRNKGKLVVAIFFVISWAVETYFPDFESDQFLGVAISIIAFGVPAVVWFAIPGYRAPSLDEAQSFVSEAAVKLAQLKDEQAGVEDYIKAMGDNADDSRAAFNRLIAARERQAWKRELLTDAFWFGAGLAAATLLHRFGYT